MKEARLFITPVAGYQYNNVDLPYADWSTNDSGGGKGGGYFIGAVASLTYDRILYYADLGQNLSTTHTQTVLNGQAYTIKFRLSSMYSGTTLSGGVRVRAIIGGTPTAWVTTTGGHSFSVTSAGTSIVFEVEGTASPAEYCGVTIDEIFLYETFVPDSEIDIAEEGCEIIYAVDELSDPSKRASSYSLTFNLPNTARNNRIFGHFYEFDATGSFSPNKKLDAVYVVNNIEVYKGILKLEAVTITNDGKITEYQATLNSPVFNLFTEWGDKELTDLDFSEFAHTINQTSLVDSINGNLYVGGVSVARTAGRGYAYVLWDNGWVYWAGKTGVTPSGDVAVPINKVLPGIFLGEYLHKMFDAIGCTFNSNFFSASPQTLIIIPPSSSEVLLSPDQVDSRLYKAEISGDTEFSITYDDAINERELTTFAYYDDITGGSLFDNTGGYDISTYSWEVQKSGKYDFNANVDIEPRFLSPAASVGGVWTGNQYCVIDFFECRIQLVTTRSGVEVVLAEGSPQDIERITTPFTYSEWKSGTITSLTLSASNIDVLANEILTCKIRFKPRNAEPVVDGVNITEFFYEGGLFGLATILPVPKSGGDVRMKFKAGGQWYNSVVNEGISETDIIDLNKVVPKGVKITDFFTSLIRMFNLFVVPDKDNPRKFYIEPRDDFETNTTVNWDSKWDLSKGLEVKPNALATAKDYVFKYSEDSDYFNARYIANSYSPINQPFGTKIVNVDNDFLDGENQTEVIFAPTLVVKRVANKLPLPSIITEDSKPFNGKIRIGYYQVVSTGVDTRTNVFFVNGDDTYIGLGNIPTYNFYYPFYAATNSLEFGLSGSSYYWNNAEATIPLTLTNNTLFNRHWAKYISEITDANSKVVTAYFKLNEVDIYNLDFSKLYFVDNYYYRLLRVYYNPLSYETTKVDLLKVKEAKEFSAQNTLDFNGGDYGLDVLDSDVLGGDILPRKEHESGGHGGDELTGLAPIGNVDNNVNKSATGVTLINARNTNVFEEARQVMVANSDNVTIRSGVNKAAVINSDNVTIESDGEVWIGGVKIKGGWNDVTRLEFLDLISQASPFGDGLRVGEYYRITDIGDGDGINNGGIIVQAITAYQIAVPAHYLAYNPDYNLGGTYTNPIIVGTNLGIYNPNLVPAEGDVVIFDGYHWLNITGANNGDPVNSPSDWQQLAKTIENGYIFEVDYCEYDIAINDIYCRKDKRGNYIDYRTGGNYHKFFRWGDANCLNNYMLHGYMNIRNSSGTFSNNHSVKCQIDFANFSSNEGLQYCTMETMTLNASGAGPLVSYDQKVHNRYLSNFDFEYKIDNDLTGASLNWTAPNYCGIVKFQTLGTLTTINIEKIINFRQALPVEIRVEDGLTIDFTATPVAGLAADGQIVSDTASFSLIGRSSCSDFCVIESQYDAVSGLNFVKKKNIGQWA